MDLTQARERAKEYVHVGKFLASHPAELRTFPLWLRQRSASPISLRIPWWPFPVPDFVRSVLPDGASVFEFGTGGSTLWFEDLGATVTAVEHDREWFGLLSDQIRSSTTVLLREPTEHGELTSDIDAGYFDDYVTAIDSLEPASLDLVTVDGRCRVEAGLRSLTKVRPGGWLLLDDSWRPRYAPLRDRLAGCECHHFEGLRPAGGTPSTTSCWRIPGPDPG